MQYVVSLAKFFGLAQNFWCRTHIFSSFAAETNLCTTFLVFTLKNDIYVTIFILNALIKKQYSYFCSKFYFIVIYAISSRFWFCPDLRVFLRKILVCQIWIVQFFDKLHVCLQTAEIRHAICPKKIMWTRFDRPKFCAKNA